MLNGFGKMRSPGYECGMGKRLSSIDALLSRLDTVSSLLERTWAGPLIGAAISGYLAVATEKLEAYAPWSWFAAAALGALAIQAFSLFRSIAKERRAVSLRLSRLQEPKSQINPLEETFHHKRIFLSDLTPPSSSIIKGKTFIDCEIVGPGVIFFRNENRIEGDVVGCDFVRIKDKVHINNLLAFSECTFKRCSLIYLTILAHGTPDGGLDGFGKMENMNVITG